MQERSLQSRSDKEAFAWRRGRGAAREAGDGDKGMNQQCEDQRGGARTISPGGPSPSSALPTGTVGNGRREEAAQPGKVAG